MKHLLLTPLVLLFGCATFSPEKAVGGIDKALAVVDIAVDKSAEAHAAGADVALAVCGKEPECLAKLGYSPEDAEAFVAALEAASAIYDELVDLKARMQESLPEILRAIQAADKARRAAQ